MVIFFRIICEHFEMVDGVPVYPGALVKREAALGFENVLRIARHIPP
jgi:hypothetical protein